MTFSSCTAQSRDNDESDDNRNDNNKDKNNDDDDSSSFLYITSSRLPASFDAFVPHTQTNKHNHTLRL